MYVVVLTPPPPRTLRTQNEGDFVSAVCYQKAENVILAANSRGLIQALRLA
jgi:hypothetical protein